ncbi:pilus assembly protein [Cellulomonas sp. PhB143]|uniref:pilus assembly protein n=1 Tax=Cellulomonas sp. PhB143 TaxID=2485186 RepID=UPI000F93E483|nr:pilus assembly protein [Cellulomonas sp. PhB143]ROS76989.1 hypothetical protein EDF32_0976 [Cellulomonas sp. PhB143]
MRGLGRAVRGAGAALARRFDALRRGDGDRGNALVEFIGATVLLLVPALYLVVAVARVQSGALAVESAARSVARAVVTADSAAAAAARAQTATRLALADQRLPGTADVSVECSSDPCHVPGSTVVVTVRYEVGLPFVPRGLLDGRSLAVPVEAVQASPVDEHAVDRW